MKLLYFAYGSNLDESQMVSRCPGSRVISPGCLHNYRLDFTWFSSRWSCGVADVVESKSGEVWGLVYQVTEQDLEALDRYEGFPSAYDRFQATIDAIDGEYRGVWVYTVYDKGSFRPPSREYLDIIRSAAEQYTFPDHYKKALKEILKKIE
jgi:gamma-glutamylcyclotransferase (GGCT)/AIG2-like uncharacterized protein YtfP